MVDIQRLGFLIAEVVGTSPVLADQVTDVEDSRCDGDSVLFVESHTFFHLQVEMVLPGQPVRISGGILTDMIAQIFIGILVRLEGGKLLCCSERLINTIDLEGLGGSELRGICRQVHQVGSTVGRRGLHSRTVVAVEVAEEDIREGLAGLTDVDQADIRIELAVFELLTDAERLCVIHGHSCSWSRSRLLVPLMP